MGKDYNTIFLTDLGESSQMEKRNVMGNLFASLLSMVVCCSANTFAALNSGPINVEKRSYE